MTTPRIAPCRLPRAMRAGASTTSSFAWISGRVFDHLEVIDYGDALSHGMWELSKAAIDKRVRRSRAGESSRSSWAATTRSPGRPGSRLAEHHGYGNVVMIHFDAHADTANILDGNLASQATRCDGSSSPARSRVTVHPGRPAWLLAR